MEQIYLAFVDTPGFFASIIRRVIGIPYVHVVLSMDADLREAYSVGRRNPAVPLIAGFEKENTLEIEAVFPHAKYKVVRMQCTAEQKKSIARQLLQCYKQRKRYHYCIIRLDLSKIKNTRKAERKRRFHDTKKNVSGTFFFQCF